MSLIIKIIEKHFSECLPLKVVNNDEYENIVWLKTGKYTKPTKEQVESFLDEEKLIKENEVKINKRKQRYKAESDNLFIEWQYEKEKNILPVSEIEKLKTAWLDKVSEIKS